MQPKPPQGFKDYLMNRGSYVLANNPSSHSVLKMSPPQALGQPLKDLFGEQENDRYKLRLQVISLEIYIYIYVCVCVCIIICVYMMFFTTDIFIT